MKNYQILSMEIVLLENQDIVTISGFNGDDHEFTGPDGAGENDTQFGS